MEDARKNNGGHSTKAKDGFDKRKNKWREALDKASTLEDVISVIVMVKTKAIADNDIQAAKLFLEYYFQITENSNHLNTNKHVIIWIIFNYLLVSSVLR